MTLPKDVDARVKPAHDRNTGVMPRERRGIQYFAAYLLKHDCFWNTVFADDDSGRYRTTAAVCPNRILRSSSVRFTGWPKFGLTSFALA